MAFSKLKTKIARDQNEKRLRKMKLRKSSITLPFVGVGGLIKVMTCKSRIGEYNNNLKFKYRWPTTNYPDAF